MSSKKQPRPAHPPGRASRAARLLLIGAASATTGALTDIYGDTHLITAAGITLAVFPVLLKLAPAAASPHRTTSDAPRTSSHTAGDEHPTLPSTFEPSDGRHTANCPDSSSASAGRPHLPRQRVHPQDQTAPLHEHEINLGDFTTPPLTVRMTVRPVLNLTTDIAPIITVRQHTDPDNEGM